MRDKHEEDEDTEDDVGGDINVGVGHRLSFFSENWKSLKQSKRPRRQL